jgi:hypothetical protein
MAFAAFCTPPASRTRQGIEGRARMNWLRSQIRDRALGHLMGGATKVGSFYLAPARFR